MAKRDLTPLVIKAQAGDAKALSELMNACYETLYYYAYKAVKDRDLAGDITQESCIEIMESLSKLRDPAAFHTWAGRIVYHQCTRHFKESKEVQAEENEDGESILDQLPDESRESVPAQVQEDKEFQKTILDMLDQLSAEQRTAMMLYYYENMSVGQIARIQGTSEGTVKSRLNYGRKAVKIKVEEYEKRHGVRLHSIASLPLLLGFLFRQDMVEAVGISAKTLAKVSAGISAAATSAGGATAGAAGAGIAAKVAAGIVAAAVTVGAVVGGGALIRNAADDSEPKTSQTTQETQPRDTEGAPDRQPSQEDPDEGITVSDFYGSWYGGVDNVHILEFSEDSLEIKGQTYTWAPEHCYFSEDEENVTMYLYDAQGEGAYSFELSLMEDGRWCANLYQLGTALGEDAYTYGEERYFIYRPADYEGYTVVPLTAENVMDYIQIRNMVEVVRDEDGNPIQIDRYFHEGFRNGLGSGSYCEGDFLIQKDELEIWMDKEDDWFQHTVDERELIRSTTLAASGDVLYTRLTGRGNQEWNLGSFPVKSRDQYEANILIDEYIYAFEAVGYALVPEDYRFDNYPIWEKYTWISDFCGHWGPSPDLQNALPEGITVNRDGTVTIGDITVRIREIDRYPDNDEYPESVTFYMDWETEEQKNTFGPWLSFDRQEDGSFQARFYAYVHGAETSGVNSSNYLVKAEA